MSNVLRYSPIVLLAAIVGLCGTAQAEEPLKITPYGFINPTLIVTYGEPETFGRANAGALTAAANPVLDPVEEGLTKTLQVAQSRIGIKIESPHQVTGTLEIDFIDFQKSTPTLAMAPRLRVASVAAKLDENHQIVAGQLWDLHAYVQPFHTNFVGAHFQAGNSGFMRLQLQWLYNTPGLEVGAALGMPAANAGSVLSELERASLPTAATRLIFKLGEQGASKVGASAIVGALELAPDDLHLSFAGALLADLSAGALGVRAEAYMAQNASNISLLSLSHGHPAADLREVGGWLSALYALSPTHRLTATVGAARLLNDEDALPAYAPATPMTPVAAKPSQGPGIRSNLHARVGWVWTLRPGLDVALEPFWLRTDHVLDASDSGTQSRRDLFGLQSSLIYTF